LTDSGGRFSIGDVPAGRYRITFGRIGYLTAFLDSVSVKSGQATVLDTLVLNYHTFNLQETAVGLHRPERNFILSLNRLVVPIYEEEPVQ